MLFVPTGSASISLSISLESFATSQPKWSVSICTALGTMLSPLLCMNCVSHGPIS